MNRRQQVELAKSEELDVAALLDIDSAASQDMPDLPVRLNKDNIVRMIYERSPMMTEQREAMVAAQYGFEEFITNLSRFEPFVEARADLTDYPERREAEGRYGEIVGGLEKETYDGAVIRFEGGISGQHVQFGQVSEGQDEVESGEGGVFRARLEVPFAGSRKRQNRVISQAFQQSTARKAILNYVSTYRSYVSQAMKQYRQALLYRHYSRAYADQAEKLEALIDNERVRPADRLRLQSKSADSGLLAQQYETNYRRAILILLQRVGLTPESAHILEDTPVLPSLYLARARTEGGRQAMLAEAIEKNPTFEILKDAIADTELQRSQAITGTLDVTAFVEASQYAFGSVSYDDRVGGWQVSAGVTVRMNDPRVLTASRLKTEAEIREFRAQIDAEQLSLERQVTTESNQLLSYAGSLDDILENMRSSESQWQARLSAYLDPANEEFKIEDVIRSLATVTVARVRLASNEYSIADSEDALMIATGEVYRMVGMDEALAKDMPDTPR